MILEEYSCEQYAGVHDQKIAFRPGMNVVLGDNEAGKSTMISGIYDALQMPHQLNGNKHRAFLERSFPTNGANAIDVALRLTLGGEHITVKKEWDRTAPKDGRISVRDLDSQALFKGAVAEEKLKDLLQYGSGVYSNIIFGRQDNEEQIMDWFFAFLSEDAGEDVTQARERVAGAVSAAGGISEELFAQKLEKELEELGGRWDFDADKPVARRENKRWENGVGHILRAYYAWLDKKEEYARAKGLIEEAGEVSAQLAHKREQRRELEAQKKALQDQRAAIENHDLLSGQVQSLDSALKTLRDVLEAWPLLLEESSVLGELIAQQAEGELREKRAALEGKLESVRDSETHIAACRETLEGKEKIEDDLRRCQTLEGEIERDRIKLGAARLSVKLDMEPGHPATVETADGAVAQDVQTFSDAVRGYARITIPGVGEVTVAPEDVDVPALSQEIAAKEGEVAALLKAYSVESVEALEEAAGKARRARGDLETWEKTRELELGGRTAEELTRELEALGGDPAMTVPEDLDERVRAALANCPEDSLASRKAVVDNRLKSYRETYNSLGELKPRIEESESDLAKARDRLDALGEVSMTQAEHQARLDEAESQSASLGEEIEQAISRLAPLVNAADEVDLDALEAETDALEAELGQRKKLYGQYARIQADFERLQGEQSDRYGAFYSLFNRYLQAVAGDELSISLKGGIVSRKNPLPRKELLSQGTRKLILLAFRLALLKYYYQDEGGVIVLDDILLDMDPDRRGRAAALLTEFAGDNQVIFTTCDPAIAQLLGGNLIQM